MASETLHRPGGDGHGDDGDDGDQPVLAPGHTFGSVTDKISSLVLTRPFSWRWLGGLCVSMGLVSAVTVAVAYLL